jgi:hypothetical protein
MKNNTKINRREIGSGDDKCNDPVRDFENCQWPLRILKSKEVLDELNNCEQLQRYPKFWSERGKPTSAIHWKRDFLRGTRYDEPFLRDMITLQRPGRR